MAQDKLIVIGLAVARNIGDEVSTYTTDGVTFTAAQRLAAINLARGEVYTMILNQLGLDNFIKLYPEWLLYDTSAKTFTNNIASLPAACRKLLKVYVTTLSKMANPVPEMHTLDALNNAYSKWKGSTSRPYFVVYGSNIRLLTGATSTYSGELFYLKQPEHDAYGSTDIPDPWAWLNMIIDKATEILQKRIQAI